jgi:hypothetical protein
MVCPITPKVPVDPSMIDLYRYMFTGKIKFNLDPAVQKDGHFAFDVVGDLQDKSAPVLRIDIKGVNCTRVVESVLVSQSISTLIHTWGGSVVVNANVGLINPMVSTTNSTIFVHNLPQMMCGDDGPLDGTEFDGMLELSGKIFNVLMELFNGEIDVFFQYDGGPEKKAFTWVLNDGATTPNEVMFNMIMTLWTTILQSYSDAGSEWFNGPVDLNKLIISIKPMDLG